MQVCRAEARPTTTTVTPWGRDSLPDCADRVGAPQPLSGINRKRLLDYRLEDFDTRGECRNISGPYHACA